MCKKDKKEDKPDTTHKTREEREYEVKNLLHQLNELGINISIPGMLDFLKHTQAFIKDGIYWEGKIPLKGTNRVLVGFLTNRRNNVSDVTLKYVKEDSSNL